MHVTSVRQRIFAGRTTIIRAGNRRPVAYRTHAGGVCRSSLAGGRGVGHFSRTLSVPLPLSTEVRELMMKSAAALETHAGSWLHEAFLARAAEPGNEQGRHALGAFLTLRLADRFDPSDEPAHPLALAYQVRATRDYLTDLEPQNVESNHLLQVVRMADAVQQGKSRAILWPPLLSYASWLEQELQLGEALDVVETALRLNDGKAPTEEIAALLQRARILRSLGQLDEATASYEAARVRAVTASAGRCFCS